MNLRSTCPVAAALDVVGDRWMLVILRDVLVRGPVRFGQILDAEEGIATNILTSRLARLEAEGLVASRVYQERPRRVEYTATAKGADLFPVLEALATWAQAHVPGVSRDRLALPPAAAVAPGRRRRSPGRS